MPKKKQPDLNKLDQVVADARRNREQLEKGYREQALKMYPWICGRCQREFTRENVNELTVHHKNHNHDYNPPDGSNWELLCVYCHDNEHSRYIDNIGTSNSTQSPGTAPSSTFKPFADLKGLLKKT